MIEIQTVTLAELKNLKEQYKFAVIEERIVEFGTARNKHEYLFYKWDQAAIDAYHARAGFNAMLPSEEFRINKKQVYCYQRKNNL